MKRLAAVVALLVAASAVAAPAPGVSVDGPVDLERLLQLTRLRESMSARLFYTYTFRQTTTEEEFAADGSLTDKQVRIYQVVPTPQGVERLLIGKDGREPTATEERKQEKRNEALQRRFEKMQKRAEAEAERRRQQAAPAQGSAPKQASAAPASRPVPQPVPAPAPPPAVAAATSSSEEIVAPDPGAAAAPVSRQPLPPPVAALPACDFEDPLASVRPPLAGSVVRSAAPGLSSNADARRKRDRASQYSLFELLNLTDHEYVGACTWEGRPMHVVSFRPPEGFDALNPVERVMTAMTGAILIDGSDLEVARAEGATIAPITWGAGMVKLKSARVTLEYARIHEELWLPRRDVFEFETRVLFNHDKLRMTHAFDDFTKAETIIETEFGGPVEP